MVERGGTGADPAHVPSIAALLTQYRDRTGASYEDMERSLGKAITRGRLQQLATAPPKSFPDPENVQRLADLLHVPVTTVLEAYAVSLGLKVDDQRPLLAITLPPGTDVLTDRDRAAILTMVRQLVEARREAADPQPDLTRVRGMYLAEPGTASEHSDQRP